ncbi:competence type IV pilus major pilin ComGC [Sporosarcina sp. Te-1]|uniref:competence type IV pilus major pilin ComGC n=1 Tax=Sporosarcina sp. Te-1 TaxID=2818390 RepID=UPI001A9EF64E|nr:prepilin-type N-terminal cleavage/methylation domain-containing protein [Sporosarcina sp. Te-1]QTD41575.1 prepilin-type N-terminal cleavage/methylation domain-containing protein [Sporosarcina sp. Te-1]
MKKLMQKRLKNEKGLTLVELLAVIVILGIIAAIAVPSIGNIIENSRIKAVKADAQTVLSAANMYFAENGDKDSVTVTDLITDNFLDDSGSLSGDTSVSLVSGGANTISGKGTSGKTTVTFTAATSKQITESKNSTSVPVGNEG